MTSFDTFPVGIEDAQVGGDPLEPAMDELLPGAKRMRWLHLRGAGALAFRLHLKRLEVACSKFSLPNSRTPEGKK